MSDTNETRAKAIVEQAYNGYRVNVTMWDVMASLLAGALDEAEARGSAHAAERVTQLETECETAADAFEEICEACDGAVNRSAALDWIGRNKRRVAELEALLKRYECRLFELGETPGETI